MVTLVVLITLLLSALIGAGVGLAKFKVMATVPTIALVSLVVVLMAYPANVGGWYMAALVAVGVVGVEVGYVLGVLVSPGFRKPQAKRSVAL